jgi:hypothetical protein
VQIAPGLPLSSLIEYVEVRRDLDVNFPCAIDVFQKCAAVQQCHQKEKQMYTSTVLCNIQALDAIFCCAASIIILNYFLLLSPHHACMQVSSSVSNGLKTSDTLRAVLAASALQVYLHT